MDGLVMQCIFCEPFTREQAEYTYLVLMMVCGYQKVGFLDFKNSTSEE